MRTEVRRWQLLGAHRRGGGVSFAVWAPNARAVRVRGDFTDWHGRDLHRVGDGPWRLFVPEVPDGARYRYDVLGADGHWREKADPMAFATECPPGNASVVHTSGHRWRDQEWLAHRARTDWASEPISVYELHLGSWAPDVTGYADLAGPLIDHLRATGFTHVQFLPLAEHPYGGSWGYQVSSYFAPTARYGGPDDLRRLVDRLHRAGIGVLVDFVPAHFPRDDWALCRFDGTALYEDPDPHRGQHPDWGTLIFDYGKAQVRDFLVAAALHWIEEFHVDGLRVDAVSSMLYLDYSRGDGEWTPNVHGGRENLEAVQFVRELTDAVRSSHPDTVLIAEEATAWPGVTSADGLGFDLKWNMGWMHDTLDYFGTEPAKRQERHGQLCFSIAYAWDERFMLPLSHDEVVHGKGSLWARMPGGPDAKAAGLRALLALMWAHPGKKLLFMGGELGQPTEWDEQGHLPWHLLDERHHLGIRRLVGDLNTVYRATRALHSLDHRPAGFEWIADDLARDAVFAFLRTGDDGARLLCVANLSDAHRPGYRIGVPWAGPWHVVLDSAATAYGGVKSTIRSTVDAERFGWQGRAASVLLDLAPSSVVWLLDRPLNRQNVHLPKSARPSRDSFHDNGLSGLLNGTGKPEEN
jgi:1,4-alpha-glucan branching enzyme